MDSALILDGVGKKYRERDPHRAWTLQESLLSQFRYRQSRKYFWSLKDVSFVLPRGKMLGVIGRNGAGKSTLLRLIGGIERPDEGRVSVNGRVGGLLELGAGFHPDLTGRENVFTSGIVRGFTRREIQERFDAIVTFSELETSIDKPMRTYSSGMQMRLGFSVAMHTQPDLLLIDEVLAVGDMAFQRKCLDAVSGFREQGGTIIVISHDLAILDTTCDLAIWLSSGKIVASGPAAAIAEQYSTFMEEETRRRTREETFRRTRNASMAQNKEQARSNQVGLQLGKNRLGSQETSIDQVRIITDSGEYDGEIASGDSLSVELTYSVRNPVDSPVFGVTILHEDGRICYNISTEGDGLKFTRLTGPGRVAAHIGNLTLDPGPYFIDVGVYEKDWKYAYDYHSRVYALSVRPRDQHEGFGPDVGPITSSWTHTP